jgi:hypothetical protein
MQYLALIRDFELLWEREVCDALSERKDGVSEQVFHK